MKEAELKCLGDIEANLPGVIPEVGDDIFTIGPDGDVPDSRRKTVLFKNRYGVLCQWQEDYRLSPCHVFYEFKFYTFRKWQDFSKKI